MSPRRGFTLVEVLVALAIVAVALAAGFRSVAQSAESATALKGRTLALSDDDVLAPRALPAPLMAIPRLYAGAPVPSEAVLPLSPSGRNEPFVIALASPEWQILLAADPLNRVALIGPTPR